MIPVKEKQGYFQGRQKGNKTERSAFCSNSINLASFHNGLNIMHFRTTSDNGVITNIVSMKFKVRKS